jgi:hypothetical protein
MRAKTLGSVPRGEAAMQRYKSAGRNSGVIAYEAGVDYIDIKFQDGHVYRYDRKTPGRREVEAMKQLAPTGKGLATFINKFVRERFAKKLS